MTTSYSPAVPPSEPSPDAPVRLKARRPADLLAAVPFLLGFHPEESLVALFLRSGRVMLTARYDLGDRADPDVADLVEQHHPTGVVLVGYCPDAERGRAVLRALADELPDDVELVDLLLVDGTRWWSLACTAGCCPAEGTPYAPAEHPLSAEAVWAGLVARPDRAAVVATVAGPPAGEWVRLRRRARPLRTRLGRLSRVEQQDALGRAVVEALPLLDPTRPEPARDDRAAVALDDAACLELALLVRDTLVRDIACALVTRDDARRHLALWQEVLSRTPPELAAAPLCLVGISAWAAGNGTLLNACCERLSALEPDYAMGRLLSDVSRRALPPAWWDAMADGLRRDLGLAE